MHRGVNLTFTSTDDEQQVGNESPAPPKDAAADANRKVGRRYRRRIDERREPEHDPLAPPKEAAADASRRLNRSAPPEDASFGSHCNRIVMKRQRPRSLAFSFAFEPRLQPGARRAHSSVLPPFTAIFCPVINEAASLAKNATTLPTSSGIPMRPAGTP